MVGELADRGSVHRLHIQTNRQKMELFVVIISCMGVGFPLSYFLLEPGTGSGLSSREKSLTSWLQAIRGAVPKLKPTFFFTDKDVAQIKSIQTVFSLRPSLCLWHIKRAMKRKIIDLRKRGHSRLSTQKERELLQLVDIHFFRSSAILRNSESELKAKAIGEIHSFLSECGETKLLEYYTSNWYDEKTWFW